MSDTEPEDIEALVHEVLALRVENQRLRSLLGFDEPSRHEATEPWEPTLFVESDRQDLKGHVNANSPAAAKIALFRLLFAGREDVYALRWESSRTGKSGWSPPSWAAGRTRRNQGVRICHLTKESWSRTSLVRATSVSTRCAAATNVDSWPAISMEKVGCSMRWPTSTPLPRSAFLLRSSDHARGKERTRGRSFLDRSRLQRLDAWECTSSARQWSYEPSSIWLATTACFRPRTSSRRDLSGT